MSFLNVIMNLILGLYNSERIPILKKLSEEILIDITFYEQTDKRKYIQNSNLNSIRAYRVFYQF